MYITALKKFGISEKEAKVYLACLELGESTASQISQKSNLPRTLIYDIIERLIDNGLMSRTLKDNINYFRAADPSEILRIMQERQEALNNIMTQLKALKDQGTKGPSVKVYEGVEGMKTYLNEVLNFPEFINYGSSRFAQNVLPAYVGNWHKERIKRNIRRRTIYIDSPGVREKMNRFKESLKLAEYRFVELDLESPASIVVYGNNVAFEVWNQNPFVVIINDRNIAEHQRKFFEVMWQIGKN